MNELICILIVAIFVIIVAPVAYLIVYKRKDIARFIKSFINWHKK